MTFAHGSRRAVFVLVVLAIAAAAAVPALAAEAGVSIVDRTYEPASITIAQGETVTWTVTKSVGEPHSVTSGKPGDADSGKLFDSGISGLQDNGATFKHTFADAGTFAYYCTVHGAAMSGTVTVTAGAEAPGEGHADLVNPERKLTAAIVLVVGLVVMFGLALVWRRMNPA